MCIDTFWRGIAELVKGTGAARGCPRAKVFSYISGARLDIVSFILIEVVRRDEVCWVVQGRLYAVGVMNLGWIPEKLSKQVL